MTRLETTHARADEAIEQVGHTRAKADAAIDAVGGTASRADSLVGRADGMVGTVEPLLDDYERALTGLAPSVRRLAETLDPSEVEALITLIDRLPRLVTHLDEDILPVLETLGSVGTDVHDLVDTVQDMRQIVKGFPGSRLFRRRGAEEIAEDEARESAGA
jgi:archaellum component FlaC